MHKHNKGHTHRPGKSVQDKSLSPNAERYIKVVPHTERGKSEDRKKQSYVLKRFEDVGSLVPAVTSVFECVGVVTDMIEYYLHLSTGLLESEGH